MGLGLNENFLSLFTFHFDFSTFIIEFFLFGDSTLLQFISFFRGDLDFLKDGFDLNFFSINFLLLDLKLITENGDCFFGFFELFKTVSIARDHLGKIFIVNLK